MAEEQKEQQSAASETVEAGDSLLDQITSMTTKEGPRSESYGIAKRGIEAFIRELVSPAREGARVHQSVANEMIAQLDERMSRQIDEILHHPDVQKLESAWRGLKLLVDRTDFRENIKIELLNVSKEDLLNDFEDSPEIVKSGLYKHIYTAEYGQFGGQPVGAVVCAYGFGPGSQDVKLAQYCASVGAASSNS